MVIGNVSWKPKVDSPYVFIVEKLNDANIQTIDNSKYIFTATVATFDDDRNENGRKYVLEDYLKNLPYLQKRALDGLTGELDHPEYFEEKFTKASHVISDIWYDKSDNTVKIKFQVLNTPSGMIVRQLIDAGIKISVSSRSAGKVDPNGVVTLFRIFTYDIVAVPGFKNAVATRTNESAGYESLMSNFRMISEGIETLKGESILNKLELMSEDKKEWANISYYAINENCSDFRFFDNINKENDEMKQNQMIAILEAQNAELTKKLRVFEMEGKAQDDDDVQKAQDAQKAQDEGTQVQVGQDAQGSQVQGAQVQVQVEPQAQVQTMPGTQIQVQPVQGGEVIGVGGVQAQDASTILPPAIPANTQIEPLAQPIAPITSAPSDDVNKAMMDIITNQNQLIMTLIDKVKAIENNVDTQAEGLSRSVQFNESTEAKLQIFAAKAFEEINLSKIGIQAISECIDSLEQHAKYVLEGLTNTAISQNLITESVNQLVVNTKVLRNEAALMESFVSKIVVERINEGAVQLNQITEMIDSGSIITGRVNAGSTDVKANSAALLESLNASQSLIQSQSNRAVIDSVHPFLKIASEADRKLFEGCEFDIKNEIVATFRTCGWTNPNDVHSIITGVLESRANGNNGKDLPMYLKCMPAQYRPIYEGLNINEKALIDASAAGRTFASVMDVNNFWERQGLEHKIAINEAVKADMELFEKAKTDVEAYKKVQEISQRGYSSDSIDAFIARNKSYTR